MTTTSAITTGADPVLFSHEGVYRQQSEEGRLVQEAARKSVARRGSTPLHFITSENLTDVSFGCTNLIDVSVQEATPEALQQASKSLVQALGELIDVHACSYQTDMIINMRFIVDKTRSKVRMCFHLLKNRMRRDLDTSDMWRVHLREAIIERQNSHLRMLAGFNPSQQQLSVESEPLVTLPLALSDRYNDQACQQLAHFIVLVLERRADLAKKAGETLFVIDVVVEVTKDAVFVTPFGFASFQWPTLIEADSEAILPCAKSNAEAGWNVVLEKKSQQPHDWIKELQTQIVLWDASTVATTFVASNDRATHETTMPFALPQPYNDEKRAQVAHLVLAQLERLASMGNGTVILVRNIVETQRRGITFLTVHYFERK